MSDSIIQWIDQNQLCLGCGLCEAVAGNDSIEMKLGVDGFFHPEIKIENERAEKIIEKVCPGVNVVNDIKYKSSQRIWGKIENCFSGHSLDEKVRTRGSSGGIISALAIYLLESKTVDAVLQVGGDALDYHRNSLKISRTKDDVLRCASSRYAPALVFDKIFEILDQNNNTYCFVGKPCDISALKNVLTAYPEYKKRFKLMVSIMCAGMSSFAGTEQIINEFPHQGEISNLTYRGNGWPGYFSFNDSRGTVFRKSYNESWGKTLNKHLHLRCKICPDGIGIQADISVGDAWETKDGYPDFAEADGKSLILVRTIVGQKGLDAAKQAGKLTYEPLPVIKIQKMQPYQYARRTKVGARILAFSLKKRRALNFKNLSVFKNSMGISIKIIAREFTGTWNRLK